MGKSLGAKNRTPLFLASWHFPKTGNAEKGRETQQPRVRGAYAASLKSASSLPLQRRAVDLALLLRALQLAFLLSSQSLTPAAAAAAACCTLRCHPSLSVVYLEILSFLSVRPLRKRGEKPPFKGTSRSSLNSRFARAFSLVASFNRWIIRSALCCSVVHFFCDAKVVHLFSKKRWVLFLLGRGFELLFNLLINE